jgi:hypothetical protein
MLNEENYNKFLLQITEYINEVVSYTNSDIKMVEDERFRKLIYTKSFLIKVKLLKNLLRKLRKSQRKFLNKMKLVIQRQKERRKKAKPKTEFELMKTKSIYRLVLKHTNNNFFVILTDIDGNVI